MFEWKLGLTARMTFMAVEVIFGQARVAIGQYLRKIRSLQHSSLPPCCSSHAAHRLDLILLSSCSPDALSSPWLISKLLFAGLRSLTGLQ